MKFQPSEVFDLTRAEGQCCRLDFCFQNQPVENRQSVSSAKEGQREMWLLLAALCLMKGGVMSSGFAQVYRSSWS